MDRPAQSRLKSDGFALLAVDWCWVVRVRAYTLIEILVATTLSLMLMGAVITMFGEVGKGITDSRAMLESADRLRVVQTRLQQDLAGVTATMNPPERPEDNAGYFEYIEGPVSAATASNYAVDSENSNNDTTVGDFDDILMFTTRSTGRPFVGKVPIAVNASGAIQSDVAEVAWFLRGRTLHRRVLLVAPELNNNAVFTAAVPAGFYAYYDVSARAQGGNMVANTLGDLTRRECRFAHLTTNPAVFPYDVRRWCWTCQTTPPGSTLTIPTLPTLHECSSTAASAAWTVGTTLPPTPANTPNISSLDLWSNNPAGRLSDVALFTSSNGTRIADDVILTNVIGFDVKIWDPGAIVILRTKISDSSVSLLMPGDLDYVTAYAHLGNTYGGFSYAQSSLGAYVDAGNPWTPATAHFAGVGRSVGWTDPEGAQYLSSVYDTWSTHYEDVPLYAGDTRMGRSHNGFDDQIAETGAVANGVVDDDVEKLTSPPYPHPLRGIQVKIRVFEPDSRQIREVTVVQEFLPQ